MKSSSLPLRRPNMSVRCRDCGWEGEIFELDSEESVVEVRK